MPSTAVRNGLYWSPHSRTWHYEAKIAGVKRNGDTGCPSRGLAVEFLADYKARAVREKAGLGRAAPAPSLAGAVEMWAAAVRGSVTPEHVQKMRDVVRRHFAAALPLPIDRLTTARMDAIQSDYLAGRRTGQGWKRSRARVPGSWNTVRRYINALVNWCVERGLLAARPFKTRAIKVQKKVLPTLWPEDAGRFLEAVKSLSPSLDVQTAVLLMLSLGLRENEALGATWEGFDGRQGVYCPPRTKNREAREIALPPGLLKRVRGAHGDGREGLVLKGPKGAHRGGYTAKTVAQAGLALGIKGLHPHSLRATFATAHWEAGTPLGQIMAMLGHAQPQTTMLYIRQRPRDAAAAQAKVAKAMGGFLAG